MKNMCLGIKVAVFDKNRMVTITTGDGRLLISYDKKVAWIDKRDGKTYVNTNYYDCSKTTLKHLTSFLGEGLAQVNEKLANGAYEAANIIAPA